MFVQALIVFKLNVTVDVASSKYCRFRFFTHLLKPSCSSSVLHL
jgi:hypothetical protein